MDILIVAATAFEIAPFKNHLENNFHNSSPTTFQKGNLNISLLLTGVGSVATAFALGNYLSLHTPSLLINAGIAGAFNRSIQLGDVFLVTKDRFADLGVENADASFTDIYEMELADGNAFPYQHQGELINSTLSNFNILPKATAITVNKVHGSEKSIEKIAAKYPADLESMEGAAVHYAALQMKISFLQIRAVSNYVEARNKENWEISLAIAHLNSTLQEMIQGLE